MIKDQLLRYLSIPLLGIAIPYLSGIISYSTYSPLELIAITFYFLFMSWSIWNCSAWLHHKLRNRFTHDQNTVQKIFAISVTNSLFGGAVAGVLTLIYFKISREIFDWTNYLLAVILSVLAVIIFTLVYEILYLSKEREIDSKVVDQLDWERSMAEISNLKNELEPHFIFNSLNTLSHLILHNPETAHEFNSKLANVYKYFLINKGRDMISLHNEMEFIENYIFLLKLRYDNQLNIHTSMEKEDSGTLMIVPFAVQIAVENAIKHNQFSLADPLMISIALNENYVVIKNNLKEKKHQPSSTGIGLKNLESRYKFLINKNIEVEITHAEFLVKLPLIYQNV